MNEDFNLVMSKWVDWVTKAEFWLARKGVSSPLNHHPIDEIAYMFEEKDDLFNYLTAAVQHPQVKLFNTATDQVHTEPLSTDYTVGYWFLETHLGIRAELMHLKTGISPLHNSLWVRQDGELIGQVPVHLSWKVSEDDYEGVVDNLVQAEAKLVQECRSAYGLFSYWKAPGIELYLKPRVNLRDGRAGKPLGEQQMEEDRGEFGMPGVGKKFSDLVRDPDTQPIDYSGRGA